MHISNVADHVVVRTPIFICVLARECEQSAFLSISDRPWQTATGCSPLETDSWPTANETTRVKMTEISLHGTSDYDDYLCEAERAGRRRTMFRLSVSIGCQRRAVYVVARVQL